MGLLILALLGLALMAGGKPDSSTSIFRETLLEPPTASPPTADFLIELSNTGEEWTWIVYGKPDPPGSFKRAELGKGDALDRQHAIDEAYEVINAERGKLPQPVNRHGLRMAADCRNVQVQNLNAWLDWAGKVIDTQADRLAKDNKLSGGELMRAVFAKAFPECKSATPKIRGRSWDNVAKGVQKIVDKRQRCEFIDLNSLAHVLAARMVAMSPPNRKGRAFIYTPEGQPDEAWFVRVTQSEDGWLYRVWVPTSCGEGEPIHGDVAADEGTAAQNAKKWIDFYNP